MTTDSADKFTNADAARQIDEIQALMPNAPIVLNESIVYFDDAYERGLNPHFRGRAYFTFHRYGIQIHNDEPSAQRWNEGQARLRPWPLPTR